MTDPPDQSYTTYLSPLASRNASPAMTALWSPHRKFSMWRRIWLALALSQRECGLAITDEQIDQMTAVLDTIDFDAAARYETQTRHDVMAHILTFGDAAPAARPIIHLGATSQFVGCNAEIILLREALGLIGAKTAAVIDALARFAHQHADMPTLGFTHYQPAQPTTVGKRATLWAHDLAITLDELEVRADRLRLRGAKGATGTQASFLALFDGDHAKVDELERRIAQRLGFQPEQVYVVTGQTYPRVVDAQVLNALAATAAVIHKIATDLRLLANRREIEEPFGVSQVGSSAMPYKRNPMRMERACALARFVMSMPANALNTCATQWFERTLDDSANRRLSLPESFLALDGALDLLLNVASGLIVYEKTIAANLHNELPFLATENLLMAAVRNGADRQAVHEIIQKHSRAAAQRVKRDGRSNDLIERLRNEPVFAGIDFDELLRPSDYIGRAPEQVARFIEQVVEPIRARYAGRLPNPAEPRV